MRLPLWGRRDREEEFDEEIRSHLQMAVRDRVERGETVEQAEAAARREFGNVGLVKEVTREMWGWASLERLRQDWRYGVRMLVKNPSFTLVAVITLALGIGVNTALFTVFDAVVLKPLPLKDPESIVRIRSHTRDGRSRWRFSYLDYLDYRDRTQAFEGLVAWSKISVALGEKSPVSDDDLSELFGENEYIFGQIVSGNYFGVLGAGMAFGRGISPEEDRTPGAHPVIVLSYSFWQRRFQADPNIVGHTVKLAGEPFTVIGVTAREF